LPVPVSPVISTAASEAATCVITANTSRIASERPTSPPNRSSVLGMSRCP
jgi:hypothetical protein